MLADNSEKGAKSPKSQTGGGHQDNIELIFANGTIFHSPATSLSRERSEPAALPLSSEVSARRHASSSFSRTWLETRLGLSHDERLMALEAREDLPPLIMRSDLLLVDRGAEKKPPRRDGVHVLSVARGLAVRQIHARLDQRFLVSGPEFQSK
jgi:hypothetical protein